MDELIKTSEENEQSMISVALSSPKLNLIENDHDNALVKRARDGDFSAFEILFERHRQLAYRFAYQMVPRRDDAEDIVQEAFVRAYQNLHRYRDEAKFTTWLLRIVSNLCTDQARMRTRRDALEQQEAGGALVWMTEGDTDDPVANMEAERRVQILRTALKALPVHHRTVIVLRDLEERGYDEIAEILGCSVGGAKLRVLRARRALKDRVSPFLSE
ncbi:MAG: sigma-70 family RNA polymerase sigma factor [Fimbriimonadaceae bacterium]